MDEMVKIEESVLELVEEELDVKQSTEESDVKTEMKTSPRPIDVKNEIDADGKINRIKRENQGCDDSSIFTNNIVKIEKDEPVMHVEATVRYMDTVKLNEELIIKDDICADSESECPAIKRIKTEHETAKWNESALTIASMAVKADPDVSLLHTEFDIKDESYSNTTASVTKNELPRTDQEVVADMETDGDTFVCYHCEYAARSKRHLIDHMKVHRNKKYIYSCCYCDFRTNSGRLFTTHNRTHSSKSGEYEVLHMKDKTVDDNFSRGITTLIDSETRVLNKSSSRGRRTHPTFITSVSKKVHGCTKCTYESTNVKCLREHLMIKHPEISGNRIRTTCIYCNKTFKSKLGLDDHIVKRHPDFIASVSSKILECTQCTYKTTYVKCLRDHLMIKHPEISDNRIRTRCIYCKKTFKVKQGLDDHIVKRHPDFIASVSSKIHECTQCTYKTTKSSNIRRHLITNHPEVAGNLPSRCIYCNKTFKSKLGLDDHIVKRHPDFIASVSSKIRECTQCTYKTTYVKCLRDHLMIKHPEISGNRIRTRCIYCKKTFKVKQGLDDHIVKRHPDFIASVSSKIHECTQCTYKTTRVKGLRDHLMIKHPEISGNRIRTRCIYCNKTFKVKQGLDDHIVKRHPDFIASVSSKIHECTQCTYRTTISLYIRRHLITNHPEVAGNRILSRCIYCNKTFKSKLGLDDHIVKRHPDFIASVSSKIYECTQCTYKTTGSSNISRHLIRKHSEVAGNRILSRCIYCNKTFKSKLGLDDHIVKRHPDFIASVSSKIHECTQCTHKTTYVKCLRDHLMIKHPEISGNRILSRCTYCTKTFVNKTSLDDHIIQIHPDFIASVSSKIYECILCTYKTTYVKCLGNHLTIKHPEIFRNCNLTRCIHCNKTFKSKATLDDHILKTHPDFIASVSSKIHKCTQCTYKTTRSPNIRQHLITNHPKVAGNRILSRCIYCNKTFKSKPGLDDHIIQIHPDFIASVSSKIHECTHCTYKTTRSSNIRRHLFKKHSEVAGNRILTRCIYCNKTFKSKPGLDNHIVKRHPDFIASVSRKVHECTKCSYKTMLRARFNKHMLTHAEAPPDRLNTCMDFNQEFKSRVELDDHIIKMAAHPEITGNDTFLRCMYCDKTFTVKQALDDHILSEHPNYIASSSKIKEGTKCTDSLNNMMLKHSETICNSQLKTCEHYNADLKSKQTLDAYLLREHPYFIVSGNDKINESTKCICNAT
ncbi:unnamed protein product [Callosobruchus maculatus]|uniref:C2H2-type domain-containing protein n=1 Tax=Callosobruchus maculatus TaxID=64391 RepID=A0A653BJZ1_CALMS|nr:unnamed protein product [Callosobruchus maculatus]